MAQKETKKAYVILRTSFRYISLRIKNTVPDDKITETIARLSQIPEIADLKQVFPNDPDERLARMCTAQVDQARVAEVITVLMNDPDVERAYESPPRRLM